MIQSGFLSEEDRKALTALARDGSSPCRVSRRANALVLLDMGLRGSRFPIEAISISHPRTGSSVGTQGLKKALIGVHEVKLPCFSPLANGWYLVPVGYALLFAVGALAAAGSG